MKKDMPSPARSEKNQVRKETLYLVATPIGNLSDLSERACKVLSEVDFIAAEDTRNTMKLLAHFNISREMISYHEHNQKSRGEEILKRLQSGESCALVTDAGMPGHQRPWRRYSTTLREKRYSRHRGSGSLRRDNRTVSVRHVHRPLCF